MPRAVVDVLALAVCPACHTIQPRHTPCLCTYHLLPPEDAGLPSVAMAIALGFAAIGLVGALAWGLWGVLALGGR